MTLTVRLILVLFVIAGWAAGTAQAANELAVTEYGVAATTLPWGIAREEGFLKKSGVAVDGIVSSNGGGTAVRNMMASDLPFAEVATSAAVAAIETGLDVAIIYSANNNTGDMAWVTLPKSPAKTLADLKGGKLGYTNPRSTTEMLVRMVLQKNGLTKDVSLLATGGIAAGLTILNQGLVAAAPVDEPEFYPPGKYRTVFFVRDYLKDVTWTVGIAKRSFLKAHPDMARKLILARQQAVDFMAAHPGASAKVFARDWQIDPKLAETVLKRLEGVRYWSRGDFNMSGIETLVEGMKIVGALKKPIALDKVIDKSFLPAGRS